MSKAANITTKVGGPAFPVRGMIDGDAVTFSGMSLRDYFAAKAVVGILNMVAAGRHDTQKFDGSTPEEAIAEDAYRLADAMLKARKA